VIDPPQGPGVDADVDVRSPDAPSASGPSPSLAEPLLVFLAVTALSSALYWIGKSVAVVDQNLHGAIALVFLFGPSVAARITKRPFDPYSAGLRLSPVRQNLLVLGLAIVLTWPIFFGAFLGFYAGVCPLTQDPSWAYWADVMACPHWVGLERAQLRLPPDFLWLSLTQLLVVAVPEEVFFRGYLQSRLEARFPPTRRLWGAPVGWALLLASLLFAVGHVLVDFNPQRMAVFFPGLVFGWMRARTGSLAAAALFHTLCNLYSDVLHLTFFP